MCADLQGIRKGCVHERSHAYPSCSDLFAVPSKIHTQLVPEGTKWVAILHFAAVFAVLPMAIAVSGPVLSWPPLLPKHQQEVLQRKRLVILLDCLNFEPLTEWDVSLQCMRSLTTSSMTTLPGYNLLAIIQQNRLKGESWRSVNTSRSPMQ